MRGGSASGESVALKIALPSTSRESDITLTLADTTYTCASTPTVAELLALTDSGEEVRYFADMEDFSRLLDYLGTN